MLIWYQSARSGFGPNPAVQSPGSVTAFGAGADGEDRPIIPLARATGQSSLAQRLEQGLLMLFPWNVGDAHADVMR